VLELKQASFGWPGEPPVLTQVDLVLARGMRVAVLGPNGAGKSTLLHALAGRLPLASGRRKVGDRARVGVFTQDVAAELPGELSAFEHLSAVAPLLDQTRLRTILGALGLSGEDALRPMASLSGGERARAALASLVARPATALLLDEPTNHLDAETVEVLVNGLKEYDGALLLVTHDRYVVEQVATHVVLVANGRATLHLGVTPELLDPVAATRRATERAAEPAGDDHEARKRKQRERERATRRIAEIHAEIEATDAEIGRIDAALFEVGGDYARARALADERTAAEKRHEALYAEWEAAQ
jgi:ATP-binding cassette subfamily F protein 3